jgi:hypothetical protein
MEEEGVAEEGEEEVMRGNEVAGWRRREWPEKE